MAHNSFVTSISISEDDKLMASGSFDYSVRVWDLPNQEMLKSLNEHRDKVVKVQFSTFFLISASNFEKIIVRNAKNFVVLHTF